jgi:hypothetical protein
MVYAVRAITYMLVQTMIVPFPGNPTQGQFDIQPRDKPLAFLHTRSLSLYCYNMFFLKNDNYIFIDLHKIYYTFAKILVFLQIFITCKVFTIQLLESALKFSDRKFLCLKFDENFQQ